MTNAENTIRDGIRVRRRRSRRRRRHRSRRRHSRPLGVLCIFYFMLCRIVYALAGGVNVFVGGL